MFSGAHCLTNPRFPFVTDSVDGIVCVTYRDTRQRSGTGTRQRKIENNCSVNWFHVKKEKEEVKIHIKGVCSCGAVQTEGNLADFGEEILLTFDIMYYFVAVRKTVTVLVFGQWRFTVAMISRWGPFNQKNWRSPEELEKSDRFKNMKTLYYVALPSQGSSEPNDTWQSLVSDKTTERSSVCYV